MKNIEILGKKKKQQNSRMKDLEKINVYKRKKDKKKSTVVIEFPTWMILSILLIVALIFFWEQLLTIVMFIFIGFILMSALQPIVNWFIGKKISKGWAIGITYFLVFLILVGLSSVVIVPFVKGMQEMINLLPSLVSNFLEDFTGLTIGSINIDRQWFVNIASEFSSFLTPSGGLSSLKSIADTLGGVINWVVLLLAVIIFSIYLLSEGDQLLQLGLLRIANDRKRKRVKKLIKDVQKRLGDWMIGQTIISFVAAVTLGVSLTLLQVPFVLPLSVLVGLLATIPNIGTTLAIVPAILIALISGGWTKALVVLVIYVIYQQIENNILTPKIMGSVVGLKPIFVMLGVMVFLTLFGVWGAVLAVPIMVVFGILYEFFIDLQKLEAEGIV